MRRLVQLSGGLLLAAAVVGGAVAVADPPGSRSPDLDASPLAAAVVPASPPPLVTTAPVSSPTASPTASPPAAPRPPKASPTAVPTVAPLGELRSPTAFVQLDGPLTEAQLAAVRAMPAVAGVAVVDTGRLRVDGRTRPALGVNPSVFRAFAPEPSARSDGLWQAVARGDLVASYGDDAPRHELLGQKVPVGGNGTRQVRLGAFAAFGLQQADVVVASTRSRQLGLRPRSGLVVATDGLEPAALQARLASATGGEVTLLGTAAAAVETATSPSGRKASTYRQLYVDAARSCPGLSWTVLAAIGQVESGHGRNNGPSSAGAIGPMQFLPSTFAQYAVDGDGDGKADPWNAYDAVPAAARLLCANGGSQGGARLAEAVFSYNHAQWYVDEVLALAARYR